MSNPEEPMPIKTETFFRPVVVCQGKQRALPDKIINAVAKEHMETAVKADAEKFGVAEGYVLEIFRAVKVKEGTH
jgi:hypothetical protein